MSPPAIYPLQLQQYQAMQQQLLQQMNNPQAIPQANNFVPGSNISPQML
jgi:hypothetical protein